MVEATPEMAKYCISVVASKLNRESIPKPPACIPDDPCPVFVSFKTMDGSLRGCIGNFNPEPLREQLKNYALAAAFDDSRFPPIELHELSLLKCTVYLLHSFEKAKNWKDWEIGVHGIRIKYRNYGATFLPSVMSEYGWDHKETLVNLLNKAGYRGEVSDSVLSAVEVIRYQESKASADLSSLCE